MDERKEAGPDCHWPVTFNYNTSGADDTYRRTNILFPAIRKHSSRLLPRLRRIMPLNEESSTSDSDTSASMSPTTRHFQLQLETDSPRPSENFKESRLRPLPRLQSVGGPNRRIYDYTDDIARLQEVHEAAKAQRQQQQRQRQQQQQQEKSSSSSTEKQAPTENSYLGHRRLTNAEWNRSGQHGPFFTADDPDSAEDQPGKNLPPNRSRLSAQLQWGSRDVEDLSDGQVSVDQETSKNQEQSQEEEGK